jgi:outer membrane receptor for ferrienterochelin and colicins
MLFLLFVGLVKAHDVILPEVTVRATSLEGRPLSRTDRQSVVQKEVLTQKTIQHKNAMGLARAVDMEPGVQTTLTCANCGSQRITLNGLRGENTTILIDGIPAFPSISSFYGMEAMPITGIDRIEIARGAGASLTAPEAIGGSVNLVTVTPDHDSAFYQTRAGEQGSLNQQLMATYGTYQGGIALAAQTNRLEAFDVDENGVAESATQNQRGFIGKYFKRIGDRNALSLRGGFQDLELLGGSPQHYRVSEATTDLADENDFRNGDVREDFRGDLSQISDRIRLKRTDAGGIWLHNLNDDVTIRGALSIAAQEQLAIYSHGYDYDSQDHFRFFDLRANVAMGESHLLTVGLDHRNEEMHSQSKVLYGTQDLARDSYNYETLGFYIQDEWLLNARQELNLVLRIDHLAVDWLDPRLENGRVDETAFAPRLHFKHQHDEHWSSRVAFGVGYRAPLSLFESQHGTNEEGFIIDIQRLERAETFSYTANHETKSRSSALSVTTTRLSDMAYGDESEEPIRFRNASETNWLYTLNALHVWRIKNHWTLEASFDWFVMPESYKEKLPVAAQETRMRFVSDYHWGKNELVGFLNIIGPRNLRPYGYERNYNVLDEDDLTFEDIGRNRKRQNAPAYFTIDMNYQRVFGRYTGILGVTNLLDTTQASLGETPLAWQQHGDHYHLDNRHLWGPTQGRVIYAGLRWDVI